MTTCPLCGKRFDPALHPGCRACPLSSTCSSACCPACGYTTIDPASSRSLRIARHVFGRLAGARAGEPTELEPENEGAGALRTARVVTLREVEPGRTVRVECMDALPRERRERLYAYGLVPGRSLHVVRQSGVTVVEVEQLELAFEIEVAQAVHVRSDAE